MNSLLHRADAFFLCLFLFAAMIVMVLLGRWCNKRWFGEEQELKGGVNSLLGAMYALSGLMLAFTFGMSGTRLERVRGVVELEANNIGTAILRADLYADSVRKEFRVDFKDYLEAVISFYENATDQTLALKAKEDAGNAGKKLWERAAQQSKLPNMLIPSSQMVPALNSMFDIATSREVVLKARVPDLIIYMLFVCVLATCLIAGFTSSKFNYRDRIIVTGFAFVTSMVIYATIDLARPMRGVIKERAGKNAVIELRKMF